MLAPLRLSPPTSCLARTRWRSGAPLYAVFAAAFAPDFGPGPDAVAERRATVDRGAGSPLLAARAAARVLICVFHRRLWPGLEVAGEGRATGQGLVCAFRR